MIRKQLLMLWGQLTMNDRDPTYLQTPEQWTSFLSALVHELRTPIASFRILTDLLIEAPPNRLGDQERRYAENIRDVAQDIQALLGDVGELARLLAGRVAVRPREVVLEQLVNQAEEAARTRAWENGVAITDSLDPALPPLFRTDPDRLREALVLLLGNIAGNAKSEVLFRLEGEDGNLRAVLSSDGPPFPEEALSTLFTPFQDGVRAARARGGRSLSLPLASELARSLGGTLRAENRGGKPAFVLSVPAAGS
jgi:signal transduction histidine kinase